MQIEKIVKSLTEMADAHCHLDLIPNPQLIKSSIESGVTTIITDGVDTRSNIKALEIADGKNIFAALGIDPEHAITMSEEALEKELQFNISMARQSRSRIIGIGEIGLDYKTDEWKEAADRQRLVFRKFIEVAKELRLPVSVHARSAMQEVLKILDEEKVSRVHLHFFEGTEKEAMSAVRRGYMISIPPIESNRRRRIIATVPIENLMAESDSPVVGESPKAVERSINMVAEAKGMKFEDAARILTYNTRKFFGINGIATDRTRLMRWFSIIISFCFRYLLMGP